MYKCEQCGKEYKSTRGLVNHRKECEPIEEQPAIEEVASNEVDKGQELSDNIRRKLDKLKDARSSTWDAQARYEIDLQIKELLGK